MKIHIFYRHYNVHGTDGKNRPFWFDFEKCFLNLLKTIDGENISLHVVMDGEVEDNFIYKYKEKYTLHIIKAGNDQESFWQTWKIARNLSMDNNDLIYFLENDYLHVPEWISVVRELYDTYVNVSYVTLYDHNDKYVIPPYYGLFSKIFITKKRHWRTTPSTCGSFIVRKQIFDADYDTHTTVAGDHDKFIYLTDTRDRFILSPMPSLSTHCVYPMLAPIIDWENISNSS